MAPPARPSPLRQRTVWRLLTDAVAPGHSVLDCGGGTGTLAVPLALLGASVTVVDVSADALAILARRAAEAGVAARIESVQGDLESLAEAVPLGGFDLVLAHGVLSSVDDPRAALVALADAARPGGLVSIVSANPVAGVLSRVLAGDLAAALAALAPTATDSAAGEGHSSLLDPTGLRALCAEVGLVVEQVHGLGVFAEFAAGRDLSDSDGQALAELEELAAAVAPYRDIAARVHVLARRPAEVG